MKRSKLSRILLASNSPRRKELIQLGGWPFRVMPADVDESVLAGEPADQYVLRLAEVKARAVAPQAEAGEIIVAADTTVADGTEILGKPQDAGEARTMLTRLRGRVHQVYTALAVYDPAEDRLVRELAATDVPMRDYSAEEIEAYIATGDPFDKAGSYAIQHAEFRPAGQLSGCYANVVGLPLCHLARAVAQFGLTAADDLPAACQSALGYDCTVFNQVQKGVL
ncbi:MAG: septum formation protein Maf [Anaerolineales bacterium]|nr:septum formation protein Maf [Anaerolineales bacterium]